MTYQTEFAILRNEIDKVRKRFENTYGRIVIFKIKSEGKYLKIEVLLK